MNPDFLLSAAEVERLLPGVSRHLVYMWVKTGKLYPVGQRGRSPLYHWAHVIKVERETRNADPAGQRRGPTSYPALLGRAARVSA